MSRETAFQNAYLVNNFEDGGHTARTNLPLYNEENLIALINQYPVALHTDLQSWDPLTGENAFVLPSYYLIEKVVGDQFEIYKLAQRQGRQWGGTKKLRKRKKTRKRRRRKYRTIKKKRRRRKVKSLKRRRRRRKKTRGK